MIHIYSNYSNSYFDYSFEEDRELLEGEYSSNIKLIKPNLIDGVLVESITQSEIDERAENELEQTETQTLEKQLQDGIKASMQLKVYIKRNISASSYKNARIQVRPIFEALRGGDWDIALDEITIIDTAKSTVMTRRIKTHIENYINEQ